MDCLQASEIVSLAIDGELVDAARLAEARSHCASCPQCASLLRVLDRVRAVPTPKAPDALLARLEGAAAQAAERVRAEAAAPEPPVALHPHVRARTPRLVAFASAAAVLLVAFTVGSIALLSRSVPETAGELTTLSDEQYSTVPSAEPEMGAAEDSTAMRTQEQAAPPYVLYGETVYVQSSLPAPSTLTTVGSVWSDLGSGSAANHAALLAPGTDEPLFVQAAPGQLLSFTRVVRTLGRAEYALVTDVAIARFGEWPTLPSEIPQPESADGKPVFHRIGFDDTGVNVYGLLTSSIDEGFAIAPGSAASDPAAGNPNWTWWERVR